MQYRLRASGLVQTGAGTAAREERRKGAARLIQALVMNGCGVVFGCIEDAVVLDRAPFEWKGVYIQA